MTARVLFGVFVLFVCQLAEGRRWRVGPGASNPCSSVMCARGSVCRVVRTQPEGLHHMFGYGPSAIALCEEAGSCTESRDPGTCEGSVGTVRYYYNARKGKCMAFNYTGCGGNRNNYSLRVCKASCERRSRMACTMRKEVGPCRARMPMYYYDVGANECRQFFYGGCRGNDNRFPTLQQCNERCRPTNSRTVTK